MEVVNLLESGGLLAFAGLVYYETRAIRAAIGKMADRIAILEERQRAQTDAINIAMVRQIEHMKSCDLPHTIEEKEDDGNH